MEVVAERVASIASNIWSGGNPTIPSIKGSSPAKTTRSLYQVGSPRYFDHDQTTTLLNFHNKLLTTITLSLYFAAKSMEKMSKRYSAIALTLQENDAPLIDVLFVPK